MRMEIDIISYLRIKLVYCSNELLYRKDYDIRAILKKVQHFRDQERENN